VADGGSGFVQTPGNAIIGLMSALGQSATYADHALTSEKSSESDIEPRHFNVAEVPIADLFQYWRNNSGTENLSIETNCDELRRQL